MRIQIFLCRDSPLPCGLGAQSAVGIVCRSYYRSRPSRSSELRTYVDVHLISHSFVFHSASAANYHLYVEGKVRTYSPRVQCRHRIHLHSAQEPEEHSAQVGTYEIRPHCPKTCAIQREEVQEIGYPVHAPRSIFVYMCVFAWNWCRLGNVRIRIVLLIVEHLS